MKLKLFTPRFFWCALFAVLLPLITATPVRAAANAQAVQQVLDSDAFAEWYARFAYKDLLLHRDATPGELGAALATFKSGDDGWQKVVAQIAGSSAYFQNAGGTNAQFVTQVFEDLVGREPDAGEEMSSALDFLKTNSREELAAAVVDTDEFRSRLSSLFYIMWMGDKSRITDAETAAGAAKLKAGGISALAGTILSSPAYFARGGGTQNGWQKTVDKDLKSMGDAMPDDGMDTGQTMPDKTNTMPPTMGNARTPLVQALMSSAEYFAAIVKKSYSKYLHRAPTPAELQKWSGVLQNGGSSDTVTLGVLTSDEYFNRAGGTTDAVMKSLSHDLLGGTNGDKNGDKNDGATSTGDIIDLLRNLPHKKKKD
jgi:hypothetical protein